MATPKTPIRQAQRLTQRAANWRKRRSIQEIEETGRFFVDPEVVPDDMSYEWKAVTCLGEELREHQVRLARDGAWEPVPANRHPEILGQYTDKANQNQPIIIGGQMLMERPKHYTEEARIEDQRRALERVSMQFESLGMQAPMPGGAPAMKPQIRRDYSVQVVPNDDEVADA